jgi:hypothetical protein
LAADLAILDVFLGRPTAGIEGDRVLLTTIRTHYNSFRLCPGVFVGRIVFVERI